MQLEVCPPLHARPSEGACAGANCRPSTCSSPASPGGQRAGSRLRSSRTAETESIATPSPHRSAATPRRSSRYCSPEVHRPTLAARHRSLSAHRRTPRAAAQRRARHLARQRQAGSGRRLSWLRSRSKAARRCHHRSPSQYPLLRRAARASGRRSVRGPQALPWSPRQTGHSTAATVRIARHLPKRSWHTLCANSQSRRADSG